MTVGRVRGEGNRGPLCLPSRALHENEFNFKNCSNLRFNVKCRDDVIIPILDPTLDLRSPRLRNDDHAARGGDSASAERCSFIVLRACRRTS